MTRLLSLALGTTLGLLLGRSPAVDDEPEEHLRVFAPLVGASWVAPLAGGEVEDEHVYSWVFGGKFLRDVHAVRTVEGKVVYEGETIYAWDPRDETLVWWYWNSTGGFLTGTAEMRDEEIHAVGENHAPAEQTQRVRSVIEIGEEGWSSSSSFWKDGGWVEQGTARFAKSR